MLYPLKKGVTPEDDAIMERYEFLLLKSKEIWEESIAGGGYKRNKDTQGDQAPAKPNHPISNPSTTSGHNYLGAPSINSSYANKPSSS